MVWIWCTLLLISIMQCEVGFWSLQLLLLFYLIWDRSRLQRSRRKREVKAML